mgnify:CR=1 FL=1
MAVDLIPIYKKMDRRKWRILNTLFRFMWKYEFVPVDLLEKDLQIRSEKVEHLLRELSDEKVVVNRRKGYFGTSFTFTGLSLYSIWRLVERGEVKMLGKLMGEGKESTVYNCLTGYGESVIKFHRVGHPAFKKVKEKRDYGTYHFSVLAVRSAKNEYNALRRLYGYVNVPRPFAWEGNAVLMELIDANELYRVKLENPEHVLDLILDEVREMYRAGVIHGDLSQFNILINEEGIWIIDFPQYVTRDSEISEDFLLRDLNNMLNYFRKNYGIEKDINQVLMFVKKQ